jgi:hypothetical protein
MDMQATAYTARTDTAALTGMAIALQSQCPLTMPPPTVKDSFRAIRLMLVPALVTTKDAKRTDRVSGADVSRRATDNAREFLTRPTSSSRTLSAAPSLTPRSIACGDFLSAYLTGERLATPNPFACLGTVTSIRPLFARVKLTSANHTRMHSTKAATRLRAIVLGTPSHQSGLLVERLLAGNARYIHAVSIPLMRCLVQLITPKAAPQLALTLELTGD